MDQAHRRIRSGLVLLLLLAVVVGSWALAADHLSGVLAKGRLATLMNQGKAELDQRAQSLSYNIEINLKQLHGFPAAIADEKQVIDIMGRFGPNVPRATLAIDAFQAAMLARADLGELDRHLETSANELRVFGRDTRASMQPIRVCQAVLTSLGPEASR